MPQAVLTLIGLFLLLIGLFDAITLLGLFCHSNWPFFDVAGGANQRGNQSREEEERQFWVQEQ